MKHRPAFRAAALAAALHSLITALTAIAPASASQGTTASAHATRPARITAVDRNFVTFAASSGMLEVDASRLALARSNKADVRAFAQRMIDDHATAREELKASARAVGLEEEASSTLATHNAGLDRLRALNGIEFDQEYAAQVGIALHLQAVAVFEQAARQLGAAPLKAQASKRLPELREQLKEGQALAKAVAVPPERMREASVPLALSLQAGFANATTGSATTSPAGDAEPPGRGTRAGGGNGGTPSGTRSRSPAGPSSRATGPGTGGSAADNPAAPAAVGRGT